MSSGRLLPNWLEGYLAYTAESESPEDFHIWTGISAIAGALRRRVYVDMGYFLVYPNMYIVLVSPPGRCKKSTAMRLGRGVLGQVPGLEFSVDSVTRERFIMDLSQAYKDGHSSMTAYSSEFASLLTSSGMDMVVFLTDIFDSPNEWAHKTKSSGTTKIKNPFLNLIAATTPDWISRSMPLDTVGIGLTSRIVFVYSDTPRRKPPRPKLSDAQNALAIMLAEDLNKIAAIAGEYTFSPDAEKMYDEWYLDRVENPNPTGDSRLSGYYERKPVHLLKVAMILAAAETDETVLQTKHLELAFGLFDRIESKMPLVFAGVGKNPLQGDITAIMTKVLNEPAGVSLQELVRQFSHSVRREELMEILDTLVLMGTVVQIQGRFYAAGTVPENGGSDAKS